MNEPYLAFPELRGRTFDLRVIEVFDDAFVGEPLDGAGTEELEVEGADLLVEGEIACVTEDPPGAGEFVLVGSRIDTSFLPGPRQVLEERGDGEFELSLPPRQDAEDLAHALEHRHAGDPVSAREVLLGLVGRNARMIDAWYHLGVIEDALGDPDRARKYYRIAWEIGRDSMPEGFDGRMPWGWLDNRPLLRAGHGLALARMDEGLMLAAADVLEEVLRLNPDDNQGIRYLLAPLYINEEVPDRARTLFESCPPDGMNHYVAALLELVSGRRRDAVKHFLTGISRNPWGPLYLANLLPPRDGKEPTAPRGLIAVGSPEEAREVLREIHSAWDDAGGHAFFRRLIDCAEFENRYVRMLQIGQELRDTPVGDHRSALVEECGMLFGAEGIEAVLRDLTGRL